MRNFRPEKQSETKPPTTAVGEDSTTRPSQEQQTKRDRQNERTTTEREQKGGGERESNTKRICDNYVQHVSRQPMKKTSGTRAEDRHLISLAMAAKDVRPSSGCKISSNLGAVLCSNTFQTQVQRRALEKRTVRSSTGRRRRRGARKSGGPTQA